MPDKKVANICAGVPSMNNTLLWRIRFMVGDPVALLELPDSAGMRSVLLLRDIEMQRARQSARVDQVGCPADFTPDGGLSGDRETATAQAAAECLRREGITDVVADRSLPLIFAEFLSRAGITVNCADVHEPPLLDMKGPELLVGDALTIEPGLYRRDMGGVRVEDMVVVTEDGCINLNTLPEDLTWIGS